MKNLDKILSQKAKDYGDYEMFWAQVAQIWTAMLGKNISTNQAVAMMIAMKSVRGFNNPDHFDSFLDAGGYAQIGQSIIERNKDL